MKDVVVIFDPSIDLTKHGKMKVEDIKQPVMHDSDVSQNKRVGRYSPFIDINGFQFDQETIESFELSVGKSFLPTLSCVIIDNFSNMSSNGVLTDDILKLFIRSENKDFKPIRQNYKIVSSSSSVGTERTRITIQAILNIDDFHNDMVRSFGKKTSFDTLQDIAKMFSLGFASNETKTDDEMVRICPNISIPEFLSTDLVPSMYKDDNSFFIVFVDQYYYLNVVEMNDLFDIHIDLRKIRESIKLGDRDFQESDEEKSDMTPFFLSNMQMKLSTENGISSYRIVNQIGNVVENGNKISMHFYDKTASEYKEFYQKNLETDGDSFHTTDTEIVKSVNFIEQYDENVHKNYYFAKMSNMLNRRSSTRFGLECNLMDVNNHLRVMQQVPIFIIKEKWEKEREGDQSDELKFDNMLSGQYVSESLSYVYKQNGGFYTKVKCVKRDFWKEEEK